MQHEEYKKPIIAKNVRIKEGEEFDTIQPAGGCFLPWWLLVALAIMSAVVMGSTDEQLQGGGLTCYDSIIWGQWCE